MNEPFVDTNLIVRLLTGDDVEKQHKAKLFFQRIERGEFRVMALLTVLSDTIYVLSSPRLYDLPRTEIVALLMPLLRLPSLRLRNRRVVLQALDIYLTHNLDFTDAVILASMSQVQSTIVYSFDEDFDQIAGIRREEP
jgi:predicted nucleic acid-binding protein